MSLLKYIETYKSKPSKIYSLNIYNDNWYKQNNGSQGYLRQFLELKPKDGSSSIFIRTNCIEELYVRQLEGKQQLKITNQNLDKAMKYSQF